MKAIGLLGVFVGLFVSFMEYQVHGMAHMPFLVVLPLVIVVSGLALRKL